MARLSNILNQKFGKLTAVELLEKKDCYGRRRWRCMCECGGEKISTANLLKSGNVKSCGCLKVNCIEAMKRATSLEPRDAYLNNMYSQSRYRSSQRNIKFELTIEQFANICKEKCYYCGEYDSRVHHKVSGDIVVEVVGVDRIDSNKGYTKDNIQWVHKRVQQMKWNISQDQFIEWCKIIAKNN
jgi:hypothetical protein